MSGTPKAIGAANAQYIIARMLVDHRRLLYADVLRPIHEFSQVCQIVNLGVHPLGS